MNMDDLGERIRLLMYSGGAIYLVGFVSGLLATLIL